MIFEVIPISDKEVFEVFFQMIHCGVRSVFDKSLMMCVIIRKMVKEGFFDIRGTIDNRWAEVLSVRPTRWSPQVSEA